MKNFGLKKMLYRNLNSFWPDSNATVNKKAAKAKKQCMATGSMYVCILNF